MNTLTRPVIKISTITLSTSVPNCILNLTNVGKYLQIDNEVVGIKYKFAELNIFKGNYFTTLYKKSKTKDSDKIKQTLFYNQVTIVFNNHGNHVNVKLFGNGSLHLTGCKSIEEGEVVTISLYRKLKALADKKDFIFLTKDENNVWVDKDKLVYSMQENEGTRHIIGYKKDTRTYIILKKEYDIDVKTRMFITKKTETGRKRYILNFDGESIGFSQIELLKNKNKFYKQNSNVLFDYCNEMIYYQSTKQQTTLIGRIKYEIDEPRLSKVVESDDCVEIVYSCNPFQIASDFEENTTVDVNVNCMNIYFNINFKLNRQRFYECLIQEGYICKYNPESYSGIKLILKLQIESQHLADTTAAGFGCCFCNNKCTCTNVTFMIFQSGNVIATGFKSNTQIKIATEHFFALCQKHYDTVKMKACY